MLLRTMYPWWGGCCKGYWHSHSWDVQPLPVLGLFLCKWTWSLAPGRHSPGAAGLGASWLLRVLLGHVQWIYRSLVFQEGDQGLLLTGGASENQDSQSLFLLWFR